MFVGIAENCLQNWVSKLKSVPPKSAAPPRLFHWHRSISSRQMLRAFGQISRTEQKCEIRPPERLERKAARKIEDPLMHVLRVSSKKYRRSHGHHGNVRRAVAIEIAGQRGYAKQR